MKNKLIKSFFHGLAEKESSEVSEVFWNCTNIRLEKLYIDCGAIVRKINLDCLCNPSEENSKLRKILMRVIELFTNLRMGES